VVIRGRDVHRGIIEEIKRHNPWGNDSVVVFLAELSSYIRKERSKLQAKGEDDLPQSMKDQHDCIRALADGQTSVKGVLTKIDNIFSEDNVDGAYVLSTIHQVKGLEADWIAVIGGAMPGPWAETKEQKDEETSIQWVAFSRTKYALVFEDMSPRTGLPKGYGWTPLEDAIANDPTKPTDGPSGGEEVIHNVDNEDRMEREAIQAIEEEEEEQESNPLTLQVSTTMDTRTNTDRGCGVNAIDIVPLRGGRPCGKGPSKTYRNQGWQYHVIKKANGEIIKYVGNGYKGKLPKLPTMKRSKGKVPVTMTDWEAIAAQYNAVEGITATFTVPSKTWKQKAMILEVRG
jgi:hypothetical protein